MIEINTIENKNCIEYMTKLPSNFIDLIIIDPPYFRILKKEKWDKFKNLKEYLEWSELYIKMLIDKLRLNGTLILYGCSRNFNILSELNRIFESNGMEFVQEIIIDKGMKSVAGRTSPNIKMLPPVTENIIVYRKNAKPYIKKLLKDKQKEYGKTAKEINSLLGCKTNGGGNWTKYTGNTEFPLFPTEQHWNTLNNIFNININYKDIKICYNPIIGLTNVWNDINFYIRDRKHPSQKPIKLADRIINIFSDIDNLVYIPFAGSGSEIEGCILNNRRWIATEIDNNYIENIIRPMLEKYK